jgi:hypothetical protein
MADSRLTIKRDQHLDSYIKAVTLGSRSAAVAAGTATPFALAAEATRPILAWQESQAKETGFAPSLLGDASLLELHLDLFFEEFDRAFQEEMTEVLIIVAGFFSDNSPGLAQIVRRQDRRSGITSHREISIWRPAPGGRAYAVVGDSSYVPIMAEAVKRSRPPSGRSFHDFGSVLWDIIKHEGEPTSSIGGGLAFGFMGAPDRLFQWPIVVIEGRFYCRALARPLGIMGKPFSLEYDPTLFAALEREHSETPFTGSANPEPDLTFKRVVDSSGNVDEIGERRLMAAGIDDWLIRELDARRVG